MVSALNHQHKQWLIGILGTLLIASAFQLGGAIIAFALLMLPRQWQCELVVFS